MNTNELKITGVQCFPIQPAGSLFLVVKVLTSEPGLYGLGCATPTEQHQAVQAAVEQRVGPFAVGRDPRQIEEFWQAAMAGGAGSRGPVLNNAVSGVDLALWDIKGKLAGVPCYRLWDEAGRAAVPIYTCASGRDEREVADNVRRVLGKGFRHVRCQLKLFASFGAKNAPQARLQRLPPLFEHLRKEFGEQVEFLYEVPAPLAPADAVWLAKALEPYRLFFLEGLLAPSDLKAMADVRATCATPLAIGKLFSEPREVMPLVEGRLIDFLRVRVSQIGGVTPALKLAQLAAGCGVRVTWHGSGDVSPVGITANVHLSMACPNAVVQEWVGRTELENEMFPGFFDLMQAERGHVRASARPGWGLDFVDNWVWRP